MSVAHTAVLKSIRPYPLTHQPDAMSLHMCIRIDSCMVICVNLSVYLSVKTYVCVLICEQAAVAEMVSDSYDADGRLVATNHSKIVLRGAGGFGGQR